MNRVPALVFAVGLLTGCAVQEVDSERNPATDDPRLSDAALLVAVCSGCHASGGEVLTGLVDYDAAQIEALMLAYRQVPDGSTAMHRMARGYTPEQIHRLADYLAGDR